MIVHCPFMLQLGPAQVTGFEFVIFGAVAV